MKSWHERSCNACANASRKSPELGLAADHRRHEAAGGLRVRRDQPERRNRLALPLQRQRLYALGRDSVAREREGLGADQDLARSRGLLQPGGDIDRIAGREPLGGAGDDLAGGDADPAVDPELGEGVSHLDRCPAGAKRVVLVQHGHAEHRHHRVADELLDRAAVRLDDSLHPLEVPREQRPQRLRIRRLAQCGRAGHVAEEHRHRLSLLSCGRRRLERRRAVGAEAEIAFALTAAARTDLHRPKLDHWKAIRKPRPTSEAR